MKNLNNKEMMEAINKGFHGYEKVVDQEIHYVYLHKKTKRYQELIFKPHANNFMHLCGVNFVGSKGKKLRPDEFYDGLRKRNLAPSGLRKRDSYTDLKLAVIPEFDLLTSCDSLRIIDTVTVYLKNNFTHAIRTRKQIFALGLEHEGKFGHFVPKSLINTKSDPKTKSMSSGHIVHCIYSVDIDTKNIRIICRTKEFLDYETKHNYPYKGALQQS